VYRVEWLQSALNQLSEIWVNSDPSARAKVTQSTNEIDRELQTDPVSLGESRSEKSRIAFSPPLGFLFRVDVKSRRAIVQGVWLLRKRSRG
jgi:hypothetical protein